MVSDSRSNDDLPAILGGVAVRPDGPPDWPGFDAEVAVAAQNALADGTWGKYHGPHCEELAARVADYHSCEHAVLCSSGTAAVEMALRGLKVGPGDEVVLAAYDFKGNFQDILVVGATPVLVDVHPDNWNLDPARLEAAISARTKAVVVTHLHGGIVPMPAVMEIVHRRGIAVVEDACQAPGAEIEGRKAGAWGDVGVHSFGGSKLLTAGRGGAFVTNNADVVQRARLYSHRGNEAYPLSELQAAILIPQWDRLDERNVIRRRNADRLSELPAKGEGIEPFRNAGLECTSAYYKLGLRYDAAKFDGLSRDDFAAAMRAEGVAVDAGFRALHCIHGRRRFRQAGELANTEDADEQVLTLHHPVLLGSEKDVDQIAAAVDKIRRHARMVRGKVQRRESRV